MKTRALVLATIVSLAAAFPAGAQSVPPGCSAGSKAACFYATPLHSVDSVDLVLLDITRNSHVVPITIRYPTDVTGPVPVVIWHHGGETRTANASGGYNAGSEEQGRLFAKTGYVVVHIVRTPVARPLSAEQRRVCSANGVAQILCPNWIGYHIYGPQNTPFVVSTLASLSLALLPHFHGTFDLTRILVGGFSGGTELVLNHAGAIATRAGIVQPTITVPGAVAYMAAAPRGPEYAGFSSGFDNHSYEGIGAAPFLFLMAINEDPGERGAIGGAARAPAWLGATPGDKFMSWDREYGVKHVNLNLGECDESPMQAAHCEYSASLRVAFADSTVKGLQGAIDWMAVAPGALAVLSDGTIEVLRR